MKWSSQQEIALKMCGKWLDEILTIPAGDMGDHRDRQVFRLFGLAGTGKTTLAIHLSSNVDGEVLHGAFTGKAALVMRKKGMSNATTIHRMIYVIEPFDTKAYNEAKKEREEALASKDLQRAASLLKDMKVIAQPKFVLNEEGPIGKASLIVLDECSMISDEMYDDLVSFNKPILVLGDPGQLPPINGEGKLTRETPNYILTQVHRQALESPIIRWAMAVRTGAQIPFGEVMGPAGLCRKIHEEDWSRNAALETDQILVGLNRTRTSINRRMRKARGFEGTYPLEGERVICLRNATIKQSSAIYEGLNMPDPLEDADAEEEAIPKQVFNGMMATVDKCILGKMGVFMELTADEEEESFVTEAHRAFFQEYDTPGLLKNMTEFDFRGFNRFDFAYAITVHKSQGSQWEHSTLYDDHFLSWKWEDRKKWLYTGITRAADRITIVERAKKGA